MRPSTRPGGTRRPKRQSRLAVLPVIAGILLAVPSVSWSEEAGTPEARSYTMQEGDRLVHLAKRFGVEVGAILEAFLTSEFEEDRHITRLNKIKEIEES